MKLHLNKETGQWFIGETPLNCGQQVQILCCDVKGDAFYVWGRFELAGQNNPIFHTSFGCILPELRETFFKL